MNIILQMRYKSKEPELAEYRSIVELTENIQ